MQSIWFFEEATLKHIIGLKVMGTNPWKFQLKHLFAVKLYDFNLSVKQLLNVKSFTDLFIFNLKVISDSVQSRCPSFTISGYLLFTQCVIMTLAGEDGGGGGVEGTISNDVLKFRKVIEFESLCVVVCFSYIYLIIDGKISFIN